MTIALADYNKVLMDLRRYSKFKGHPAHGKDTVPDNYGQELIDEGQKANVEAATIKKWKKTLGLS